LFFFQAEDGIRDKLVTGVQTCALPIYHADLAADVDRNVDRLLHPVDVGREGRDEHAARQRWDDLAEGLAHEPLGPSDARALGVEIGRASCRERVEIAGDVGAEERYD